MKVMAVVFPAMLSGHATVFVVVASDVALNVTVVVVVASAVAFNATVVLVVASAVAFNATVVVVVASAVAFNATVVVVVASVVAFLHGRCGFVASAPSGVLQTNSNDPTRKPSVASHIRFICINRSASKFSRLCGSR